MAQDLATEWAHSSVGSSKYFLMESEGGHALSSI